MSGDNSGLSKSRFSNQINVEQIRQSDVLARLTRLATLLCDAPVALINILEKDMQYTLASSGISLGTLSRKEGICHYVIQEKDFFEVRELDSDSRFSESWYVQQNPPFKYFAGIPLVTSEGDMPGALCILDRRSRQLSQAQQTGLRELADLAVDRVERHLELEEARNVIDQKDELMRMVSHDLRNPIMGIVSASDLMLTESDLDEEDAKEILLTIKNSGEQMFSVVSELLDNKIYRFDRLEACPHPTDPCVVLDEIVQLFQFYAMAKEISVDLHKEREIPDVELDKGNFFQIVGNILSNAIKFTPRSGNVNVKVDYKNYSDKTGRLLVWIRDNGIGIPRELIDDLFQKNSNGRKGTIGEPSYGLGLYIVKKLLDGAGGTIDVKSEVDEGTTVKIELPAPALSP